jgi:RHS repeat-associated protein
MEAWGYNCDAETLSETRVWGSEPENVHCSSATTPLRIEVRWGCEECREKTAVGSGVTFKYDPFGKRIYKSSSAGTSIYAYDGDNLIEETNSSGTVVARYEQTQSVDEPIAILRSSATSYYHEDGLGSVTSLSNGAGSLAQTYTFDSYGKQTASSGSLVNSFQYTGREFDTETGLYYYRARYYDPVAGRFLSEDPLQTGGGDADFYRYSSDDPTNVSDPYGESGTGTITAPPPTTTPVPPPPPTPGPVSAPKPAPIPIVEPPGLPIIGPTIGAIGAIFIPMRGPSACMDEGGPAACGKPNPAPPSCKDHNDDCDLQYENDSAVCRVLPDRRARARCWRSAGERYENCKRKVYIPPLVTDPDW